MTNTENPRTLTELNNAQKELTHEITGAVIQARAEGSSWAHIGAALGISKQAAQQKYGAAVTRDRSRDAEYTPEENAKADEALAIMTAIAAKPEPSIFLEPKAPAKAWTPPADSPLGMYENRETSSWYETYGCGECGRKDRPDSCPNCRRR